MKLILLFLSGSLFGFGLTLCGMLDPSKVQAFLNITQKLDPSLAFVMIGGILTTSTGYYFILKRSSSNFGSWPVPVRLREFAM